MDKVTGQCPQTTTILKRKESQSGIRLEVACAILILLAMLCSFSTLPLLMVGFRAIVHLHSAVKHHADADVFVSSTATLLMII